MGLLTILAPILLATSSRRSSKDDDVERGPESEPKPKPGDEHDGSQSPQHMNRAVSFERQSSFNDMLDSRAAPSPFGRVFHRIWDFVMQGPRETAILPDYRQLPILSGMVVPFSILLEIPGLTENWYIRTEAGKTVEIKPNPTILDVGMAISMACGVLANIFLLLRFLERAPRLCTILAIVSLTLHDIINVVAVTVFGVIHRINDGFTYGESFWITLCSTIASTFVNVTLIYDFWTTPEFAEKGSGLTRKQRSLVIVIMLFLCYIAVGASINHALLKLDFVNSLYFTIVSITTVGYGDITPDTTGARIFTIIYIVGAFEQGFKKRKHAITQRRREHRRRGIEEAARVQAIERQLEAAGYPVYVEKRSRLTGHKSTKLNKKALNKEQICNAIEEAHEVTDKLAEELPQDDSTRAALTGAASPSDSMHSANGTLSNAYTRERPVEPRRHSSMQMQSISELVPENAGVSPSFVLRLQQQLGSAKESWDAQEESYRQFQESVAKQESKDTTVKLAVAWMIFLTFWLLGALIFRVTERWTYGQALYYCFITFSTIGYGDFSPSSPAGRAIFSAWALMGVAAMTVLISVLGEVYSDKYHDLLRDNHLERAMKEIRKHNSNHDEREGAESPGEIIEEAENEEATFKRIHDSLGQISTDLINCAKRLHEDLHFLSTANAPDSMISPERLEMMLADVEDLNIVDKRLKEAMLNDSGARKTLFVLGYEHRLRKLIDQAEVSAVQLADKTEEIRKTDLLLKRYGKLRHLFSSQLELSPKDSKSNTPRQRKPFMHLDGLASDPSLHEKPVNQRRSRSRSPARSIS
ncbi:voltage-gated potassium channel [Auriculariales sp. MPI-PUGE-AT-0066]|nr:voltage-gated potassium channel [Auriculariales sp. MPI-PUGE-AT-0066]